MSYSKFHIRLKGNRRLDILIMQKYKNKATLGNNRLIYKGSLLYFYRKRNFVNK